MTGSILCEAPGMRTGKMRGCITRSITRSIIQHHPASSSTEVKRRAQPTGHIAQRHTRKRHGATSPGPSRCSETPFRRAGECFGRGKSCFLSSFRGDASVPSCAEAWHVAFVLAGLPRRPQSASLRVHCHCFHLNSALHIQ